MLHESQTQTLLHESQTQTLLHESQAKTLLHERQTKTLLHESQTQTLLHVSTRYRSAALGETHMTMLHFFPRHGRKHQIRIHCADGLGCSIVGDPRHRGTLVGQGLFLCAIGLDFAHPTTGEPLSLSLPYPPRFVSFPSSQHQVALPLCVCVCVCVFFSVCVCARARDKFGVLGRCTDPRTHP